MNYTEALDYLFEQLPMFHRIGPAAYKNSLDNTLSICRLLGNPEQKFRSVHIAGTNGKGSVSHFLSSIFQEAGYKTGLFTSPHLKDFRERIRVNGKMIPKGEVIRFITEYRKDFENIQPSFFEWTWGLAVDYFAKEQIDIAILETGMGGRLDSTNVVTPELSVITNIGYDHMQFLGNTLEKIAEEKAGIIKPGIPVVIGETHPETAPVFNRKALETGSAIYFADTNYQVINHEYSGRPNPKLRIKVMANNGDQVSTFESPLTGLYQLKNIVTVLQSIKVLRSEGFVISDDHIEDGIRNVLNNTHLKGRWQVIGKKPLTVADIGHNKDGVTEVLKQIEVTPHENLRIVLGMVNDKDIDAVLGLLPATAIYYFCKANIPRGLDASLLQEKASNKGLKGFVYLSVKDALINARNESNVNDLVVVTGSAFVVAEAL
jgi:dihydrofolate synthase/folylpolyglutamate synthase